MINLTKIFNPQKSISLYAYIDKRKKNIDHAYITKSGNLCIRGDKLMDKTQLGKLLIQGLYVNKADGLR